MLSKDKKEMDTMGNENLESKGPKYPLHEKIQELSREHDAIQEFLEHLELNGYLIGKYEKDPSNPNQTYLSRKNNSDLVAEFFEIDPKEFEEEKRQILASIASRPQILPETPICD